MESYRLKRANCKPLNFIWLIFTFNNFPNALCSSFKINNDVRIITRITHNSSSKRSFESKRLAYRIRFRNFCCIVALCGLSCYRLSRCRVNCRAFSWRGIAGNWACYHSWNRRSIDIWVWVELITASYVCLAWSSVFV